MNTKGDAMTNKNFEANLLRAQKNEITEHLIYKGLAANVKDKAQVEVLARISSEELGHYDRLKAITKLDVTPDAFQVFYYSWIARIFGLNFGLKLMENGETMAQDVYAGLKGKWPDMEKVMRDEKEHEVALINMIDEDRLKYISSVVLGVNDALIELTASLAGFALALQNTRLIGIVGLITGIAAATSMAASEYLSTKEEGLDKDPVKACVYTGIAYIAVVGFLVFPYFFFKNVFFCLGWTILDALIIIYAFTFYISVAKGLNFNKRFIEMAALSIGVSIFTFFLGYAVNKVFGITP
jgi:VIT1/CCC1 family predicted Fe2+/Mn2+ transporter